MGDSESEGEVVQASELRDPAGMGSSSASLSSPKKRGRSQVEEDEDNAEGVCCGICYAERGVSIAGEIDCCSHYFCFVCIMEWAKHESRCPICRQRFSNVRRLPMHGVFSSSRDVKVPHRDQAYHPHGNVSIGHSYAETKCGVCRAGIDEHLLLLCDLCDTASHTYCVGLGYTVPEGDWFCHDCAISRETNANEESDQQCVVPEAKPSETVDIFDIVRETGNRVVKRPRTSPLQQNLSSPSAIPLSDRLSRFKGKSPAKGVNSMQRNILAFRENWNALRSGSLRFHCDADQPSSTVSQNQDSRSLSHGKRYDSRSGASTSVQQQSPVQGGLSSKTLNERVIKDDVDKAWKMVDRAKRMQLTHQRISSNRQGLDRPSCSGGGRKTSVEHSDFPELKDQHSKELDSRNTKKEKQSDYSRLFQNFKNCSTLKLEEKKESIVRCEEMIHRVRDHSTHSEGYRESPLSRKVPTNIQCGAPCREEERNACQVTSADLASSRGKFVSDHSSCKDVDLVNEEKRLASSRDDGSTGKTDDAKTEIQALVKLNLKLLTRDKKLGFDTFKVVARQATHTVLAACSSEQQKCCTSSSCSVCCHSDNTPQFQKSTLMPNCCRQCFYAFVNNVVSSTMMEKVGCA